MLGVGLATAGLASAADPRKAGSTDTASLENAFKAWVSTLNEGKSEAFLQLHHEQAVFVDEDSPFRMSRDDFVDHLGFHGKNIWEGFAWVPRSSSFRVFGDTGVVAGNATFRGKPRNAGFRLRHLLYTHGWTRVKGEWKLLSMHLSPVAGHIVGASPS